MISPLFLRARNNQVNFVENPQMKMISSEKQNMEIQFIKIFKETAVNRTGQFINEWSLEIFIQMKPICSHVISKLELCIKMLTEILQFPVTIFDKTSDLYYNSTNAVHFSKNQTYFS